MGVDRVVGPMPGSSFKTRTRNNFIEKFEVVKYFGLIKLIVKPYKRRNASERPICSTQKACSRSTACRYHLAIVVQR